MCEKKPGPRCSADTRAALVKLGAQIDETKVLMGRSYNLFVETEGTFEGEGAWEAFSDARARLGKLRAERVGADFNYDASPEGLKSLESLIASVGDSVVVEDITERISSLDVKWDSEQESFWDSGRVTVSLSKRKLLKQRYQNAADHREWQKKVGKVLNEEERKNLKKAEFVAGSLKTTVVDELKQVTDDLSQLQKHADGLYAHYRPSTVSGEDIKEYKSIEYKRRSLSQQKFYLSTRLEDMEAYCRDLQAKKDSVK